MLRCRCTIVCFSAQAVSEQLPQTCLQDLRSYLEQRAQGLQGFEQRSGLQLGGGEGGVMQERHRGQFLEEERSVPAL
jgi:hypothetical protein